MATRQDIENYVTDLQMYINSYWEQMKYKFNAPTLSIDWGRKNAKVVMDNNGQRSVHHFVELETGNILKAAGWSAPAKGIRGNIATATFGPNGNVDVYGARYFR